jgi:hypothetical protein
MTIIIHAKVREIKDEIKDWLLNPREGTFSFKAFTEDHDK